MLTVSESASYLNVSESTVRRLLKWGDLEFIQPAGRKGKILITIEALEKFKRENTVKTASPKNDW